jgi:hypothetical protein
MVLLAGPQAFTQGTLVFDQQASTGTLASGGAPILNQQPMGQSFTPSLSAVGFVQFQFFDTTGIQGATVYVNLVANSITGNVIAATSPVFMPNSFHGITNFFFSSNIPVQPEVEYFFLPVLQSGDNTDLMGDLYPYSRGTAIFSGQPSTLGVDFWFREGIVVPEPATGSFLLMGAAGAMMLRQKRRRIHPSLPTSEVRPAGVT